MNRNVLAARMKELGHIKTPQEIKREILTVEKTPEAARIRSFLAMLANIRKMLRLVVLPKTLRQRTESLARKLREMFKPQ